MTTPARNPPKMGPKTVFMKIRGEMDTNGYTAASQTAAFHLANALEEQEHSRGVLVFPLPVQNEGEPLTQLLCFGGFPGVSEAAVYHCATTCGLAVAAVEIGSVVCLNELHLVMLAERLVSRCLGTQGYVKNFDDVFARHSDLFPPPPTTAAEPRWNEEEGDCGGVIDFVEAAKIMVSINMRATQEPWSPEGQLGLTLFLEPMVFKRVHPPFAYLQHLSLQQQGRKGGKKQQQQLEDDAPDEEGLCGAGGVFPPGEAVLEMRVVKFLPDLTNLGLLASLPSPVMELTPLEKANARRGFDLESPKDEESMRSFWRLAHSLPLPLPPHPLEYVRVFFKGQGSTSITYPAACLVSQFAHNYSRTTQAYPRLLSTFLQLLTTLPGVIKAFTTATSSPSSSSSSLMPVGKRLTSPEKLGPGALKTARQLRDEEQNWTGGEEGGQMINLLVGGGQAAAAASAAAEGGAKITHPLPSSSSSSTSSSSSSRKAPTTTGKKAIPPQKKKRAGPFPPPPASSTTSLTSSSLARQQQQEEEEKDGSSSKSDNHEEEEDDDLFSDKLTGTSAGLFAPSSSSSAAPANKPLMPPPLPASHPAPPSAADMPADKPKKKTAKKKAVGSSKTLKQVLGGGDGAAAAADPTTTTTTTTTAAADTPIKKKATVTKKKKQVDGGAGKKVAAKKT